MGTKIKTCVIVGASPTTDSTFIRPILKQADYIICADGGWNYVHLTGVCPHLIVGDFDSACDIIPKETESVSLPTHKDDTDLLVAVKEGLKRGYTDFVILGALGGRLDHTYGNLCVLQYILQHGGCLLYTSRPAKVRVSAQNRHGERFEFEAEELFAVACCHEIDHLNGILFREHVVRMVVEDGHELP